MGLIRTIGRRTKDLFYEPTEDTIRGRAKEDMEEQGEIQAREYERLERGRQKYADEMEDKRHKTAVTKAKLEARRNLELERATRTKEQAKEVARVEHKAQLQWIRKDIARKHTKPGKVRLPDVRKDFDFGGLGVAFGKGHADKDLIDKDIALGSGGGRRDKKGREFDPVFG